jgi:hypothetical protein
MLKVNNDVKIKLTSFAISFLRPAVSYPQGTVGLFCFSFYGKTG